MVKRVCNMCGRDFDEFDKQEQFGFHYNVGYGSKFDESAIQLDLCCQCFDELMDYIIPKCKISPIEDEDIVRRAGP